MKKLLKITVLLVAMALLAPRGRSQESGERYRGAASFVPTGIWMAAARGDIAGVKKALAEGEKISQQDPIRGYTPLHAALASYEEDIIQPLLELGADVNVPDADDFTPLALAVRAHNPKLVKLLINRGAQISREGFTKNSAFTLALCWGNAEVLQLFFDAGVSANSNIRVAGEDMPALAYAAYAGTADAVESVYRAGANLETEFGSGSVTALFSAVGSKRFSTLDRLIKLGADTQKISNKGNTAAVLAAIYDNERGFERLIDAKCPLKGRVAEAIEAAWCWGNQRINKKLETLGYPVIEKDPVIDLAEAALAGDLQRAKKLYAENDGNYDFGRSLITSAASGGNVDVLRLVTDDSDAANFIRYSDSNQRTVTHHAALAGKDVMLSWLLKAKPDLGSRDRYGQTPLMCAVREGHLSTVEQLIMAGSPLDAIDVDGQSALDLALLLNHDAIVARLKTAMPGYVAPPSEPQRSPHKTTPRVSEALPPITLAILPTGLVDESWYPTTLALKDFESLVQTQVQTLPGIECVERAELDRIQEELTRQTSGGLSYSQGLAIGTLTRAELLVTSILKSDRGLGRYLTLNVVDSKRGDILSTRTLHLKQTVADWLKLTPEITKFMVNATVSAVQEARSIHKQWGEKKVTVFAPLFIGNRTPRLNRLGPHSAALLEKFHEQSKNHAESIRVLRFSGASDAKNEAELAISGLSQSDDKAWTKVADYYLWGWCEETGPMSTPFPKMPVRVSLQLLDSGGRLTPFECMTTVENLQMEMAVKAKEILSLVTQSPGSPGEGNLGPKIALDLGEHAFELAKTAGEKPTFNQQTLINRSLEVARFFDPSNPKIAALCLMERWAGELSREHRLVWRLLACYDEWANHFQQFGTEGLRAIPFSLDYLSFEKAPTGYNSLEADWHNSAWYGVCEKVHTALQVVHCFPDGTPPSVRRNWRRRVSLDFQESLLKLQAKSHRYSYRTPSQGVLIEGEVGGLAGGLTQEWRTKILHEAIHLPVLDKWRDEYRLSYDDLASGSKEGGTFVIPPGHFRQRKIEFEEPEQTWRPAEPTVFTAPPPTSPRLQAKATAATMPDFWQQASPGVSLSMGSTAAMTFSALYDSPQGQDKDLFFWQPDTTTFIPVLGFPTHQIPRWLVATRGRLWVGGPSFGLGFVDLKERRYSLLPEDDGFPFEQASSALRLGKDLCVSGGGRQTTDGVAVRSDETGWRLLDGPWTREPLGVIYVSSLVAGPSSLYVFYSWRRHQQDSPNTRLAVLNTVTQRWSMQTDRIPSPNKQSSGASADADGLWMLMNHDVAYIPTDDLVPARTIAIPSDVTHGSNADAVFIHDGEWLWIGMSQEDALEPPIVGQYWSHTCRVVLIHKPSRRYAGCYEMGFGGNGFTGMLLTQDHLLLNRHQSLDRVPPLIKVQKAELLRQAAEFLAKVPTGTADQR